MASSIVQSVAQQLGNLLVEETKYLYEVSDKIEKLQKEMAWMECFLRDADTQQHQEKVICMWVSEIRDLAYEAEDIVDRYLHEVSHHRQNGIRNTLKWLSCMLWTCDALTLHTLGSDIDNMTITISDLTSRLQRYGIQIIKPTRSLEYKKMAREQTRTHSHIIEDVVGLKNEIQEIVDLLVKDNDVKVVGISGTGGLGKTTLARKVFQNKVVNECFSKCAWVYISKEFQSTQIFQEIFNALKKDANPSAGELPGEINKVLEDEKCLVVLDDMWEDKDWKWLKPAFESIFRGSSSKLLITTRNQSLLECVDREHGRLHCLKTLSPDESWELLQQKAFVGYGSIDDDQVKQLRQEMEKLGRDMLKHCDGLPLAIVALGGILSTRRTIFEWEDVQKNITSYLMNVDEASGEDRVMEVLALSYHDLPFYLKPCFLYLGNFPEDYKICTQRLYQLWDAEGLLKVDGETSSYDIGEKCLNQLVQRSMVQVEEYWPNGRIKYCRVHDIMRDLCLKKCEEVDFLSVMECTYSDVNSMLSMVASRCTGNKKIRRLAVHGQEQFWDVDSSGKNIEKKAAHLRSILVISRNKRPRDSKMIISQKTFRCFPLVRVLDFQSNYAIQLSKGVKELIHLRYFRMPITDELLPSCFYDLKFLETVDLQDSMSYVLGWDFRKLERLKHLYLPNNTTLTYSDFGGMIRFPFSRMETLVNFYPSLCEIEDLQKMTRLRVFSIINGLTFQERDVDVLKGILEAPVMNKPGQLINSIHLKVSADILKEKPAILSSLGAYPSCFELTISGYYSKKTGNDDIRLAHSLIYVSVEECDFNGDLFLALEKLPRLKHLIIEQSKVQSGKLSFSPDSFPQLQFLRLNGVGEKYVDWEWEVGPRALPNLRHLEIFNCKRLKKLPEGLPDSIQIITCYNPCIRGIENYGTCSYFKPERGDENYHEKINNPMDLTWAF